MNLLIAAGRVVVGISLIRRSNASGRSNASAASAFLQSIRPFVTHAVPEFGNSEPQKHKMSPVQVVLWTDLHNSIYIHYCTPSTTHDGGFRLCVPLDFTVDTSITSIFYFRFDKYCCPV